MKQVTTKLLLLIAGVGLAVSFNAYAEVDNLDLLDGVLVRFQDAITPMATDITAAASRLFWALAIISMIWTFGQMVTRNADIGEFFGEFFRFTFFTGLFWWLLTNGPAMAVSLMTSMRQLGGDASGLNTAVSPSNIVDVGFAIFDRVVDKSSIWSPAYTTVGILIAGVILVVLALIAMNMLILLISGWILAYAGAFFLGFGGAQWTSDMAIGYFKTVLNIAGQLLAMVVIVGLGNTILADYYSRLSEKATLKELAVELVVAVVLLGLVNKIPGLIGGLASGGGVHTLGHGIGAGSVSRGAMGLQAGIHAGGQALGAAGAGMAGALGGAAALYAAVKEGHRNTGAGTDIASTIGGSLASMGGAAQDFLSGGGGSGTSNSTGRSLAEQMGTGMTGVAPVAASGGGSATGTRGGDQSSRQGTGLGAGSTSGGAGASQGGQSGKDAKGSGGSSTGAPAGGTSGSGNGRSPGMGGLARDGQGAVVGSTGRGAGAGSAGSGGGVLGTLAAGGRITADAAANLGAGVYDFGMEKATNAIAAAKENIGRAIDGTWGGQVAGQIRERGARGRGESGSDVFDGNSLSAAASRDTTVDAAAEIAAFRDRTAS